MQLMKLVKQFDTQLKRLGFEAGDLGTHSCRKGVAKMVATGYTVSPPIVALCIWEGSVLDGMKDNYLFGDKSSDQYVEICASCLDQLKNGFVVSPPYFYFTELCEIDNLDRKRQIFQFL